MISREPENALQRPKQIAVKHVVRIKDMARDLSLSICTVSKILNNRTGSARYSPETVDRVRRHAEKVGYFPNKLAQSLASGRTRTIGLCLADLSAAMFGSFASAFEKGASEQGLMTLICTARDNPASEMEEVKTLMARCVDALVISPISEDNRDILRHAESRGCKIVLFDRPLPGLKASEVGINNREAMAELVRRCLGLGHKRIGIITGSPSDYSLLERLAGVEEAVAGSGARIVAVEGDGTTTEASGLGGMHRLMKRKSPPTLVLTMGSTMSVGALHALKESGKRLGRDVSMAGFDDFVGADLLSPALTVITQPVEKMAQTCLELACRDVSDVRRVELKAEILWRESVVNVN